MNGIQIMPDDEIKKTLDINVDNVTIEGELTIPQDADGLVVFAHGSGSSRFSSRNNFVAKVLQKYNLATFLVDLLTEDEDMNYEKRFDIDLLAQRLAGLSKWFKQNNETKNFKIGYFGASTGAAAAIKAAEKNNVKTIVSRGGRVDLAGKELSDIKIPTLLIVGEKDDYVVDVNKEALHKIKGAKELCIIPNATHLFEEPGALEDVAKQAADWFYKYLKEK